MDLRLIVFDVDGTLVDSQAHILGAMTTAYASFDLPVPERDQILSIIGLSLPQAMEVLSPGLSVSQRDALVDAYKSQYVSQRHDLGEAQTSPLYPGVRSMLDALASVPEHILGVATGKSRRGLDYVLNTHGLTGFFATEQVADHHPSKPHPAMLEAALRETGTDNRRAWMIGDTTYDIEMGRAAGMKTIGVAWGYHPTEHLTQAGADFVVTSVAELAALVTQGV
jgi:phosphoglycolate phosphatase